MPARGLEPTLSLSYIVVGLIAMIASLQTCIRAWYDTSGTAEMEFRWRMKRGAFTHGALAVPLKEINFNVQESTSNVQLQERACLAPPSLTLYHGIALESRLNSPAMVTASIALPVLCLVNVQSLHEQRAGRGTSKRIGRKNP